MLICNYCGQTFFENEIKNGCCPCCGAEGEYEQAYRCPHCGDYFAEDDLEWHFCNDCYEELKEDYRHDLKALREINNDFDKVEINSLYTHYFNEQEIDEILFKELQNSKVDLANFIEEDKAYFLQQIERKEKVNERGND